MVRVLHIMSPGSGSFGGIDAYLLSYYRELDKENVHFDFAFCGINTMKLYTNDPLLEGSKFTEIEAISIDERNTVSNWKKLYKGIQKLIKKTDYDIIEVHTSSPLILAVAGMALSKVKKCKIAHSHAMPVPTNNSGIKVLSAICQRIIAVKYNYFFACSYDAGIVFGTIRDTNRFSVISNAIDCKRYKYDPNKRKQVRNNNHVEDQTTIIGYVARLSEEKNHRFLIEVFSELYRMIPDSSLWIIGEGPERENIEKWIKEKELENNVIMFGQRKDVPDLLQAMDAFVVPSFREGLCIAAIESQSSGLPTIVSTGIPDACCVTDLIQRISLDEGPQKWAELIVDRIKAKKRDMDQTGVIQNGFDLEYSGQKLEQFYQSVAMQV